MKHNFDGLLENGVPMKNVFMIIYKNNQLVYFFGLIKILLLVFKNILDKNSQIACKIL